VAFAEATGLVHVTDDGPGIRRRRRGTGFSYVGPDGERVGDAAVLARIRALAIPPAWEDVWIAADPLAHIQATGRDIRGRKQYRYHPDWQAGRSEAKFSSLADFATALPALRESVEGDIRRRGLPRERVVAAVVWLLDHTAIRIGNEIYRRENRSFGLTTLRSRHLEIEGARLRFAFRGKSGREWQLKLTDRRIARVLSTIDELPGQTLFQYLGDDGSRHPVTSAEVNDYIRAAIGPVFSSRHFRTWTGTTEAAWRFAEAEVPETKTALRRRVNEIVDLVAGRLNNTRSVCRTGYIHPAVFTGWEDGSLRAALAAAIEADPAPGLRTEESAVLAWLSRIAT